MRAISDTGKAAASNQSDKAHARSESTAQDQQTEIPVRVVDADVHPMPGSTEELLSYIPSMFRGMFSSGEQDE
jgi:hypothetical protein